MAMNKIEKIKQLIQLASEIDGVEIHAKRLEVEEIKELSSFYNVKLKAFKQGRDQDKEGQLLSISNGFDMKFYFSSKVVPMEFNQTWKLI